MNKLHDDSSLECHVILQKSLYADLLLKKHFLWFSMLLDNFVETIKPFKNVW